MKRLLTLSLILFLTHTSTTNTYAYGECTKNGPAAFYNTATKACACLPGYGFNAQKFCVTSQQLCQIKFGENVTANYKTGACVCKAGYDFSKDITGKTSCVSLVKLCTDKLGPNANYNNITHTCICNSGYTVSKGGACAGNINEANLTVKELDTDNAKAFVKSEYEHHIITYGAGCSSTSFKTYINKKVLVNLGTNFTLDISDKITLPDTKESCEILKVEKTDITFSFIKKASAAYVDKKTATSTNATSTKTITSTAKTLYVKTLKVGSSGDEVINLQNQLGISPATGYFGQMTRKAVVEYQKKNNLLPADGIVGSTTRSFLNK